MIVGHVDHNLEATVTSTIRAPSGSELTIPLILDTGYDGHIILPPNIIETLQLEWLRADHAQLADGSIVQHEVFRALMRWDGLEMEIEVDLADSTPLLGTALLRGRELNVQFRPHGKVTIKKLPPKGNSKKR